MSAQRPLRVAIVALYPLDSAHMIGGMRVAVYNLVQALAAFDDLDIHVVYCHAEVTSDHTVQQGRVTAHFLAPPSRRWLPNYLLSLQRIGQCLAEIRPDVVNGHTSHFVIPSLRAGLPTVLTLHGAAHREAAIYNQTIYDRLRFGLALLYDRYTLSRIRHIVAISPYIMREYAGRTKATWQRIDNPLPEEYFALPRRPQAGRILYAGTITPLKDIATLLRAVARVRSQFSAAQLRLAGRTGDAAYERELRAYLAAQGMESNVAFLGLLDTPAMLREYAACSLVVLPSRQEVLPMTVIEAMAAGIPVVATRAGGLGDLIEDGVTGSLVEVGDDAGMTAAIVQLLGDEDMRRRMGEEGKRLAAGRFRAAVVAARYRDLYRQVSSNP
jgi:glycosyltransferase involved in cell wall biosynthesis